MLNMYDYTYVLILVFKVQLSKKLTQPINTQSTQYGLEINHLFTN